MRAADHFNSDLYVVAATVIPVYFVALMLPGAVLARYAAWAERATGADQADALRFARDKDELRQLQARVCELEAGLSQEPSEEVSAQLAALKQELRVFQVKRRRIGAHAVGFFENVRRWPVAFAVICGASSEVQAVLALNSQHASPTEHQWVMIALIGLPIVTTIACLLAVLRDSSPPQGQSVNQASDQQAVAEDSMG